jgi:hypothetical protein
MAKIDKDPQKQKAKSDSSIREIERKKAYNKTKAKSDSLMRESERKKAFAKTQANLANAQIKRGVGKESVFMGIDRNGKYESMPSAKDRLEMANNKMREAKRDSIASVNLMPKGVRAAKPSPMPKPRKSTRK